MVERNKYMGDQSGREVSQITGRSQSIRTHTLLPAKPVLSTPEITSSCLWKLGNTSATAIADQEFFWSRYSE